MKSLVQPVALEFIQLGLEEKPLSMEMHSLSGQCITFFIMKRFLLGLLVERCNLSSVAGCVLPTFHQKLTTQESVPSLKAHNVSSAWGQQQSTHICRFSFGEPGRKNTAAWWMLSVVCSTPLINFLQSSSDLFVGISLFCTRYCLFKL